MIGVGPVADDAQLVVNQRQELRRGVRVALPGGVQEASDLVHEGNDIHKKGGREMV